jgi:hypothetical protein
MANDPPFATLNHFAADLGIPSESDFLRLGITPRQLFVLRRHSGNCPGRGSRTRNESVFGELELKRMCGIDHDGLGRQAHGERCGERRFRGKAALGCSAFPKRVV